MIGLKIRSPMAGCWRTMMHSSGVSGPFLLRMVSAMPSLPMSWSLAARLNWARIGRGRPTASASRSRVPPHAPGMTRRIGVSLLHRSHQAVDRGEESAADESGLMSDLAFEVATVAFVFLFQLASPPGNAQGVAKLFEVDGLEEIMPGAGVEALEGGVGVLARRHDDDRDIRPAAADLVQQPDAASAWHGKSVMTMGVGLRREALSPPRPIPRPGTGNPRAGRPGRARRVSAVRHPPRSR